MGSVNITLANGQLGGVLQTNDGIVGMVLTGATETVGTATYTLETPILVTSLDNMAAQGISITGNAFAYRQVKEFYNEAGTGASLYLMLVASTVTVAGMADNSGTHSAKILLDYAAGAIKVLGIMSDDTVVTVGTPTNKINPACYTALTNMKVMAAAYATAQRPFRCIIGGTSYQGTPASLTDISTGATNNRCAILIGDTLTGVGACLGLLLGRIASIPVQRKISRVRTGAMTNSTAFLGATALASTGTDNATIDTKGFITWKTYAQRSGFFMSNDRMATASTDDYFLLARGRIMDKVQILAYQTFVSEVDDEVPINADGTLDAGFCKWLSTQMENQINNTMTSNSEISSVTCFINPAQNILSTNTLAVTIGIVPVGYATVINITLQFVNPNS